MAQIHLYGHPDSGHAVKVALALALALALAEVPHQTTFVDIWAPRETRPADFLAASPLGQVPLLVIDDLAIAQSGAILLDLADRFGLPGTENAEARARTRALLFWEHNRIGLCLPQLVEARTSPTPDLMAAVPWLEDRYHTDAAAFAPWLGEAEFFHGDRPGIADCAIWGYTQWIEKAGLAPTPEIEAWRSRMRALPAMRSPEAFFPTS